MLDLSLRPPAPPSPPSPPCVATCSNMQCARPQQGRGRLCSQWRVALGLMKRDGGSGALVSLGFSAAAAWRAKGGETGDSEAGSLERTGRMRRHERERGRSARPLAIASSAASDCRGGRVYWHTVPPLLLVARPWSAAPWRGRLVRALEQRPTRARPDAPLGCRGCRSCRLASRCAPNHLHALPYRCMFVEEGTRVRAASVAVRHLAASRELVQARASSHV